MTAGAWRAAAALAAVAALIVAGCGGGGSDEGSPTPNKSSSKAPTGAKAGGDLKGAFAGDVDWLDPRMTYYQYGFFVTYAIQRPLYSFKPDDAKTPVPDLASGPPEISSDGKTVTVKIRPGIKYSPPVNRVVTTKDVAYAMESSFKPNVPSGYAGLWWGDLTGLKAFKAGKTKHIAGIQTPDDTTIVFHLDRPRAAIFAGALALPGSAPVPEEYAKPFDNAKGGTSTYQNHVVSTGPYMVKSWKPGQEI